MPEKIELEIGYKTGSRKTVRFSGTEIASRTVYDEPGRDARGTKQVLYQTGEKFRVFARRWSHWRGEDDGNHSNLSAPMTREELIENYAALASEAGIQPEIDLDSDPDALDE